MFRGNIRRVVKCTLIIIALLFLAVVIFLSVVGFPGNIANRIIALSSLDDIAVQAKAVKLDLLNGVRSENVHVYKKGVIGPAFLDAGKIIIQINPMAIFGGKTFIRKIKIVDGIFRNNLGSMPVQTRVVKWKQFQKIRLEADNLVALGVQVKKVYCDLQVENNFVYFENVNGIMAYADKDGHIEGTAVYVPDANVINGRLTAAFDPHLLLPMLNSMPFLTKVIKWFEFDSVLPAYDFQFGWKMGEEDRFDVKGRIIVEKCFYRSVQLDRASAYVLFDSQGTNSNLVINNLLVDRDEGSGHLNMSFDFKQHMIEFDGVSAINPAAVLKMIGIYADVSGDKLRFEGPVSVIAGGKVDYYDYNNVEFEADVSGEGIGAGPLVSDTCNFTMNMDGLTNRISDLRGKLYKGDFSGSAVLTLPYGELTNVSYYVIARLDGANFAAIARDFSREKNQDYEGRFSADVEVEGLFGHPLSALGFGSVNVKNGRVFMLPVFGGFSRIMTKIIPGLNFVLRQTDAKADFVVNEGKVHSDEIQIEGDILSLSGNGDYYFSKSLDFNAQVKLLKAHTVGGKVVRAITYPISKLFEFRLRGTVDDSSWYPVNFSSDILEKIGLKKADEIK